MSKGAAMSGISQSAASQHVQEVERRLGTGVFDRSKRPLELTPAGKAYAEFCRDVLQREAEFTVQLEGLKEDIDGAVRVASIYSIGLTEMSRLRQEFAGRYPAAHLSVEYMRPDKIYEAIHNDAADLGIVSYPEASREISAIPWRDEEMQVAVPPGHALAGRERSEPAELNGETFIAFDEDLAIRRELDRFLRTHGVDVRPVLHFDNIQMIKEAVASGAGVSILPARTMEADVATGRLAAVPLNSPGLARPVGVVHRKKKKLNRAAKAFLEVLVGAPVNSF